MAAQDSCFSELVSIMYYSIAKVKGLVTVQFNLWAEQAGRWQDLGLPGRPWSSLAGLGLPWQGWYSLAGLGLPKQALVFPGRPWSTLVGLVLPWQALVFLGRPWAALSGLHSTTALFTSVIY